MSNFIIKVLLLLIGIYVFYTFFDSRTGWKELSKDYKTEKPLPNIFVTRGSVYMNGVSIKGLNLGVSEEGLFLSYPPINFVSSTLLIPWNDISHEQVINNISIAEYLVLELGNPKKSNLKLFVNDIEEIHENYGEPIFYNKLEESNYCKISLLL